MTPVAVPVIAVSGVVFAAYEQSRINKVDLTHGALAPAASGEPINILVVRSDSRAFAMTTQDRNQFGAGQQADSQRSDTMMVVRIDPRSNQAMILSLAATST